MIATRLFRNCIVIMIFKSLKNFLIYKHVRWAGMAEQIMDFSEIEKTFNPPNFVSFACDCGQKRHLFLQVLEEDELP